MSTATCSSPEPSPTDYAVTDGMTLDQLTDCAHVLAASPVVGLEVGKLERVDGAGDCDAPLPARRIVTARERIVGAP